MPTPLHPLRAGVRALAALVCLGAIHGCSGDAQDKPPPGGAPVFHYHPSWVTGDRFVFYNGGIDRFGPGWTSAEMDHAGVVLYDVEDSTGVLAFPRANLPRGLAMNSRYCCLDRWHVVICDTAGTRVPVAEDRAWTWRDEIGLCRQGDHVVWQCADPESSRGIWILDRADSSCTEVGPGTFPVWNPQSETIAYLVTHAVSGTFVPEYRLVTYDLASSRRDSLVTLPFRTRAQGMCFSPDGTQLSIALAGADNGIFVLTLASGHYERLWAGDCEGVSWGRRGILFVNTCDNCEDSGCGVIWLLDPQTRAARPVTERLTIFPESKAGDARGVGAG